MLSYVHSTSDAKLNNCVKDVDSPTNFEFDIVCDESNIAGVLGTATSATFALTWTASLTSPYSTSAVSSAFSVATIEINNPCAD